MAKGTGTKDATAQADETAAEFSAKATEVVDNLKVAREAVLLASGGCHFEFEKVSGSHCDVLVRPLGQVG